MYQGSKPSERVINLSCFSLRYVTNDRHERSHGKLLCEARTMRAHDIDTNEAALASPMELLAMQ